MFCCSDYEIYMGFCLFTTDQACLFSKYANRIAEIYFSHSAMEMNYGPIFEAPQNSPPFLFKGEANEEEYLTFLKRDNPRKLKLIQPLYNNEASE